MSDRARVLLRSEHDQVRKVVARVLRWNRYCVVEAANPRDALFATKCDIALIDVAKRNLDTVTRDVLAADLAGGILFFDGTSVEVALGCLRALVSDVGHAIERFGAE